jgi:hypothetical protein
VNRPDHEFEALIVKAQEGTLSDEDRCLLNTLMQHPDHQKRFFEMIKINCALMQLQASQQQPLQTAASEAAFDEDLWKQLAIDEKAAPQIQIVQPAAPKERIQLISRKKVNYQVSPRSLITAAASLAAIFLMVLFARFAPPLSGREIATLVENAHAEWIDAAMPNGSRVAAGNRNWRLKSGAVELLFDNNARVIIEGPADFQLVMADQIALNYGQLYANVPSQALGFTVTTANTKIIDLGTEFGVQADSNGTTELHVLQGRTTLIAAGKNTKTSTPVTEGMAKRVSGADSGVLDITCSRTKFARMIVSESGLIWRGENLKLADIVSGGNGFGETRSVAGIDPATGEYTTAFAGRARGSEKQYCPVVASEFIDGVFIPDGNQDGTISVTSQGHTFECPDTGGNYTFGIIAYKGNILKDHPTVPPAVFKGQIYENAPLLMMHSNTGITFDLQAIRRSLPGLHLENFKAQGGLTEALERVEEQPPDVDFWILVDGEMRYEKKAIILEDGLVSFDVKLSPQDRFLTVIVSDGSRPEGLLERRYSAFSNDFFYLVDPTLQAVPSGDN